MTAILSCLNVLTGTGALRLPSASACEVTLKDMGQINLYYHNKT